MIELSTAIILLGFSVWFFLNYRRETHLSHIDWVVGATQCRRDYVEKMGETADAQKLTELADTLSRGCGVVALNVSLDEDRRKEVVNASMAASADGYLNLTGVTSGGLNYRPTKNALLWLGKKMSKRN